MYPSMHWGCLPRRVSAGGVYLPRGVSAWECLPRGLSVRGVSAWCEVYSSSPHRTRGRHPPPPETATAANGTHPTGMHSWFINKIMFTYLPPANEVVRRQCFHRFLSGGVGYLWSHVPSGGVGYPEGRVYPPPVLQKRAVRILLEWFLVSVKCFSNQTPAMHATQMCNK